MDQRLSVLLVCLAASLTIYPSVFVAFLATVFSRHTIPISDLGDRSLLAGITERTTSDLFYHLGGNGPWIPKINGTVKGGIEPPSGCRITQVHMLSRHAERYPTTAAGARIWNLYTRIQHANVSLNGSLSFATDWDFFMDDPTDIENLVSTGPFAGTLEAFEIGVRLRTRYKDLLDESLAKRQATYWASDSARVIDTAKYFGAGFFGIDNADAKLQVIPETPDRGADTLTPGRTCLNYRNDVDPFGHGYGYRMMDAIRATYEPAIVARLLEQNPDFPFSESEIFSMQVLCGFETLAKGGSPWCDVFTAEEWESFEYARDVIHYYRSGPGNPYGATMGWLWLNATTNLLVEGPGGGPLYMSFVHDGDIIPLLAALDLFPQKPHLPTTHVEHNRTFRTSDVVPMGGRIIFERLVCEGPTDCWSNAPFYPNHIYCAPPEELIFVRVNVNDGIVALPGCDSGPGRSCPLHDFVERVEHMGEKVGEFRDMCGLDADGPAGLTFLHQQHLQR